jgi:nucleoside-diphosphate-sugar epimerase
VLRPAYVLFPELRHSVLFRAEFGEAIEYESASDKAEALREPVPLLRGYVLPEDAAAAFRLAIESGAGFGVYHLAADDVLGSRPLRQIVRDAFGDDREVSFADLYQEQPRAAPYDSSSARRDLGWLPSKIASNGFQAV